MGAALVVVVAGCATGERAGSPTAGVTASTRSSVAVDVTAGASAVRLPTVWRHPARNDGEGMTALIQGTLDYDQINDCLLVADGVHWYPIVWPAGTEPSGDPVGVVLPSGQLAIEGDQVRGGGGFLNVGAEYAIPGECLEDTSDVAVFNPNETVAVNGGQDEADSETLSALTERERGVVLAAAAAAAVDSSGTLDAGATLEVVEVTGRSVNGYVEFDAAIELGAVARDVIAQSFRPAAVTFVDPAEIPRDDDDRRRLVIWMSEPSSGAGGVEVTTGMSCGSLCGEGATYVLDRSHTGDWTVTGTTGIRWES